MKKQSLYNVINIIGIGICMIFVLLIFALEEQKILFGVLLRGAFGLLMIYNGIYLLFTKGESLLVKSGSAGNRKIIGMILMLTGLLAFITAVMGYGLNGYPALDWKSIFNI
ncbi:MAG: hypothetical protein GX757_02335 [Clostridiales bacterium]|nr:hypothetical protein [Clostridiales bacterium]